MHQHLSVALYFPTSKVLLITDFTKLKVLLITDFIKLTVKLTTNFTKLQVQTEGPAGDSGGLTSFR